MLKGWSRAPRNEQDATLQQAPPKSWSSPHLTSIPWNRDNLFLIRCLPCSTQQIPNHAGKERGEGRADGIILMQIINNQSNPSIMTRLTLSVEIRKSPAAFPGVSQRRIWHKVFPSFSLHFAFFPLCVCVCVCGYNENRAIWEGRGIKL